jgi:hypothetical protein
MKRLLSAAANLPEDSSLSVRQVGVPHGTGHRHVHRLDLRPRFRRQKDHAAEGRTSGLPTAASSRDNHRACSMGGAAAATKEVRAMRDRVRFLAAGLTLGVALLLVAPATTLAGPAPGSVPAGIPAQTLVKAGSFSVLAEVVDSNGAIHLAASNDLDVWYLTNRTGSWTASKVFKHTASPSGHLWGQPTIALDEHNRVHIAATRFPYNEGDIGIFYATDKGHPRGTFGTPVRIAPDGNGEPQLKVYQGHLFLVDVKNWCCVGDGKVVMRTNWTGSWTSATIGRGQNPSFRMTTTGFARVVFERGDPPGVGLYFAVASSHKGNFGSAAKIAGTGPSDSNPILALRNNAAQIVWRHFNSGSGHWQLTYATPSGWHPFLNVPGSTADMAAAFDVTTDGFGHILLAGLDITDNYRCGTPVTWCTETVASSVNATAVAARRGPGGAFDVAWIQTGDIWFAAESFTGP